MLLKVRHGERYYEVQVPYGCRVVRSPKDRSILLIPGRRASDTHTWLPAEEVLQAARAGEYGLALLADYSAGRPAAARAAYA